MKAPTLIATDCPIHAGAPKQDTSRGIGWCTCEPAEECEHEFYKPEGYTRNLTCRECGVETEMECAQ